MDERITRLRKLSREQTDAAEEALKELKNSVTLVSRERMLVQYQAATINTAIFGAAAIMLEALLEPKAL